MDITYLEGEEAAAAQREANRAREEIEALLHSQGAKSFEAAVLTVPPVSDVDAD